MSGTVSRIKEAMAVEKISVYRLAKNTKICQPNLHRMLSGESNVGIETIEKIVESLGYEIVLQKKCV